MSYQADKENQDIKQEARSRSDEHLSREMNYSGMPNSVMREMMGPRMSAAEDEADRLSAGITSGTPNSVLREMGSRLGSDFSSVRFHSGPDSVRRNEALGARAFTQRNDIYFGKGGFEPRVAAHELVHTAQQGAAGGPVRQSVAPGTVQMWSLWPFGKKKSKYDNEQNSADIADSLFRIQAGFAASKERENAERDAQYAKTYESEMKRINRANRGMIREKGSEKQDQEYARIAAKRSAANLTVKKKDYVSRDDKENYDSQIRSISKETYKELLDRRQQAAKELVKIFGDLNQRYQISAAENSYRAANGIYGRNFKLYYQLVKKIEQEHEHDDEFRQWMNELQLADRKNNDPLNQAVMIFNEGITAKNKFVMTDKGIKDRPYTEKISKDYYKTLYKKKKTRLDRMAAVYKRKNDNLNNIFSEADNESEQPNLIRSENDNISSGKIDGDENSFFLEGLPESNNIPKNGKDISGNLISTKTNENADVSDSSFIITGMKESNNNIISADNKDEDEGSVSDGAVKSAVENYISTHSNQGGMGENVISEEDDGSQIIRQPGNVTDQLADEFIPSNPTVGAIKEKSNKGKLLSSIAKGLDNVDQLGTAFYDQNLLRSQNANTIYVKPALGAASSGLGVLTGLAGTATGIVDTSRNFRNVKAGGRKLDVVSSGLDTLSSLGNTAASGLGMMKNMGGIPMVGGMLKTASQFGGENMIPGLNVAAGGLTVMTGAYEGIRGQKSINTIDDQIKALRKIKKRSQSEDQEKLMKIFKQGRRVGELHRTGGGLKAVGGGIALGTGIALLSGPLAPITAGVLGISGAGVGIFNFIYGKKKKAHLRKDVTAEEMGFKDWKKEIKRVKAMFPRENISDEEAKEIILKGHGFEAKTRMQAFKKINSDRASTLLKIAEGTGPLKTLADKVIGALGVSRRKGRYAAGAQKLIAEKLGGA